MYICGLLYKTILVWEWHKCNSLTKDSANIEYFVPPDPTKTLLAFSFVQQRYSFKDLSSFIFMDLMGSAYIKFWPYLSSLKFKDYFLHPLDLTLLYQHRESADWIKCLESCNKNLMESCLFCSKSSQMCWLILFPMR